MRFDDRTQYLLERFVQPAERLPLKGSVIAGLKGGLAGGVMLIVVVVWSHGQAALLPFQVLAYGLTGSSVFASSAAGMTLAILAQLAWATALGAGFGLVLARFIGKAGLTLTLAAGVIYGLLVWIVGQYVVVGFLAPQAVELSDQSILAAAHSVYGLCLGVFGYEPSHHRRSLPPNRLP